MIYVAFGVLFVAWLLTHLRLRERQQWYYEDLQRLRDDRDWWQEQADYLLDKYRGERTRAEEAEAAIERMSNAWKMDDTPGTERAKWEGNG